MLSSLSKIFIIISLIFFISGCTKKSYNSSYYQSKSYKNSNKYKKIKNQPIRNSKAMHRATMRSYVIAGKRYYPTTTKIGASYKGIASHFI